MLYQLSQYVPVVVCSNKYLKILCEPHFFKLSNSYFYSEVITLLLSYFWEKKLVSITNYF